jgi:hypothetical protein
MTGSTGHQYNIGDTVLVHIREGVHIPGVIEDAREGQFQVKLAQPWSDETGRSSDDMWASPDQLEAFIERESGGQQALPG